MKLGSHVGMSGKEMLLGSAKEAVSYGANTFMFYTGAPQNTRRKEISELNISSAWEYMKEHGIDEIIVHAPYIINLGNSVKPETFELAVEFLAKEIERTAACKSHTLVLHPGSHVGAGTDAGIRQIIKGLNAVLTADTPCHIALETMAGKGSEIGRTFEELAQIYKKGKYCIFTEGRKELTGVGNFFINLTGSDGNALLPLVMLDSNMYGEGGWFYSGFDRIHDDQVEWCMNRLNDLKKCNPDIKAMAFFHMPPAEFKEAYRKMKIGDKSVIYQHGSIAEKNEHFGISKFEGTFFNKAVENGVIKWMFCGHDHLNTLSLIYKGIQMTYGMSIDYLGYKGINKSYIQRGGTLITRKADGDVHVDMVPLGAIVSTRISGVKSQKGE